MTRRAKDLNCVSLFSGGGGMCLGLENAGFNILFASDIEKSAADTFSINKPDLPFIHKDVRRIERSEVEKLVDGRKVHLVCGGSPCQGFSTIGDQLIGDPRNILFSAFQRIVKWTDADCFLMENVSYLRSQYGGKYEREITASFEAMGYKVEVATLNAADYGVPQIRNRVLFFGTKLKSHFNWPEKQRGDSPTDGLPPHKTVGSAIMDLARYLNGKTPANHTALDHGEIVIERYKLIPEGGRLPPPSELPKAIRRKNFGNTYKRLHRLRPSLTLVPGNNAFPVHPTLNRSLTPREAARLQTFPDDYVFSGNRAEQCKLVGNAVPVLLAECIGREIVSHLKKVKETKPRMKTEIPAYSKQDQATDRISAPRKSAKAKGPTAVSFFSGAGGLALGFINAGFRVLGSYDKKNIVAKNFALNFPEVPHFHSDITELTSANVRAQIGNDDIDVVLGGSPCQGFSIFGRRRFVNAPGHEPENDERNELAISYVKLAAALRPKVIFLENVKGILSMPRGSSTYIDVISRALSREGYEVQWKILNCADYGVPQLRERFILVALRKGLEFHWPEAKFHPEPRAWQKPYLTVGDVIMDLMDPATIGPEFSHMPMNHKPLLVERYKLIPEGGRLPEKDLPDSLRRGYRTDNVKNFSHVYRRLSFDRPATTMVPGHNAFPVHPRLNRTLTVREAARIQTFPDEILFTGSRQQQCMLVGNAVPPLLATVLAQCLRKSIEETYSKPGYKRDIYDLRAAAAR